MNHDDTDTHLVLRHSLLYTATHVSQSKQHQNLHWTRLLSESFGTCKSTKIQNTQLCGAK
uniref:Uncharacterized protein n=1 Tax=Rhizophora mucronata TaxID=61149 RepID=A0A2P2J7M1_RHIMU